MDRNLFLCCQSFLYPLPFCSKPSDYGLTSPNDSNTNAPKGCHEVLLDGMNLSIEPCENTSSCKNIDCSNENVKMLNVAKNEVEEHSTGPAYFLQQKATSRYASVDRKIQCPNEAKNRDISSEDGSTYLNKYSDNEGVEDKTDGSTLFDPTFCMVQLILHTAKLPLKGMTTPVKKRNRRDLSEIEDKVERNDETILIANIDGDHFQVDLNRIYSIRVESGHKRSLLCREDTNEISNSDLLTEVSSCLILEMPSCCFRIFMPKPSTKDYSVIGDKKSSRGTDDERTKFDAVRDRLERLLSDDSLLPFPLSYSGLIASSEKKLEPNFDHEIPPPQQHNNVDPLACSRRCLHSYSQSWNDLILFDNALENPYSATSMGSTREIRFKDTVNILMSRIPKQVSLCFIEEDNLTKALELHENKIATKIEEFDGIIEAFWNETSEHSSNNKRQRNNFESVKCQSNIQNDCVEPFSKILKDHKKYVISKHELYLLPLRG